jgi:hypothetical protein
MPAIQGRQGRLEPSEVCPISAISRMQYIFLGFFTFFILLMTSTFCTVVCISLCVIFILSRLNAYQLSFVLAENGVSLSFRFTVHSLICVCTLSDQLLTLQTLLLRALFVHLCLKLFIGVVCPYKEEPFSLFASMLASHIVPLYFRYFYLIHLVIVVHDILIYLRYYQSLGGVIYQLLCMCLNVYSVYRYPSWVKVVWLYNNTNGSISHRPCNVGVI